MDVRTYLVVCPNQAMGRPRLILNLLTDLQTHNPNRSNLTGMSEPRTGLLHQQFGLDLEAVLFGSRSASGACSNQGGSHHPRAYMAADRLRDR
jgi:hypothetical protein